MRKTNRYTELEAARAARRAHRAQLTQDAQGAVKRLANSTPGMVIQEAAPLLFQAMCRREGIKVFFTESPCTDGKSIWLGPIDLTSPLASVYVYGHGCHERNHVVYTDFRVSRRVPRGILKRLYNIFEDIRIDSLGSEDYEGYLLWRAALFDAYDKAKLAFWNQVLEKDAAAALEAWLYLSLEVQELEFTQYVHRLVPLREKAVRVFGEALFDKIGDMVLKAYPLANSEASYQLAKKVGELIHRWGKEKTAEFEKLDLVLHRGERDIGEYDAWSNPSSAENALRMARGAAIAQGSLFSMDGEPTRAASVVPYLEGYSEAREAAETYRQFLEADRAGVQEKCETEFRALLTPENLHDMPESISNASLTPISIRDYDGVSMTPDILKEREAEFLHFWRGSGALSRAFQASLEARVRVLDTTDATGWELDDTHLWEVSLKEDRLFQKERVIQDKDTAVEVLLDSSGSMIGQTFSMAKVVALRLFEALNAQRRTRAALALFPGPTCRGVGLVGRAGERTASVLTRIAGIPSRGPTPMIPALYWAASRLVTQTASRKVIFVITDGTFREEPVSEMIAACESLGITTVMLGIGPNSTPKGKIQGKVVSVADLPRECTKVLKVLQATLNAP